MEYFEIFGLKREPFSNSPDPELFYATPGYLEALHKLEIAIRLKRGLNLVLGDVGTGKTTMSRVLLRTLDEEKDKFLVRLVLDPGFSSDEQMISYLLNLIGANWVPSGPRTVLMDALQKLLFQITVEQGKVVVVLIDEGQKLSPSGLETLRELLNFESNQWKLLQLVVFGQWELWERVTAMGNLLDRVNLVVRLSPLSLTETRAMINHRLRVCGMWGASPIFSEKAVDLIYERTGGHPRKIVSLCHHAMLAALIKGETIVTPECVKRGLKELEGVLTERGKKRKKKALFAASIGALCCLAAGGLFLKELKGLREKHLGWEKQSAMEATSQSQEDHQPLGEKIGSEEESSDQAPQKPSEIRVVAVSPTEWLKEFKGAMELDSSVEVMVRRGDTLSGIVEKHLSMVLDADSQWMKRFAMANPHISDPNRLTPGVKIKLPTGKPVQRAVVCELLAWFPRTDEAGYWALDEIKGGRERILLIAMEEKGKNQGFAVYRPLESQQRKEGAETLEEGRIVRVLMAENLQREVLH